MIVGELVSGIGVSTVDNNEKNSQDETPLNSDHYEKEYKIIDVYHHFDSNIEELVLELIKSLKDSIKVEIINEFIPRNITLDPGVPKTNI